MKSSHQDQTHKAAVKESDERQMAEKKNSEKGESDKKAADQQGPERHMKVPESEYQNNNLKKFTIDDKTSTAEPQKEHRT